MKVIDALYPLLNVFFFDFFKIPNFLLLFPINGEGGNLDEPNIIHKMSYIEEFFATN
jgi:hypothetical protein